MKEHVPVMVNEVLEALRPWEEVGTTVDATLGLGGHSGYIMEKCINAYVIGFDQDPFAREAASVNLSRYRGRFEITADNSGTLKNLRTGRDGPAPRQFSSTSAFQTCRSLSRREVFRFRNRAPST